jgi:[ribosomal protein S5]-alanine N-acetyltransferase
MTRTTRLRIERLVPAHAAVLFEDLCEPALYTFIPDDPPVSVEALAARYERLAAGAPPDRSEAWRNWTMFDAADGRPVGTLQATIYPDGCASIAYLVVVRRWREGFAREGVAWMLDHLVANGVTRFDANIDTRNAASIGLVESLGFRRVRTLTAADHFKGAASDEYVYELTPARP